MTVRSWTSRLLVGLTAAMSLLLVVRVAPGAATGGPAWDVTAESIPTDLPPGGDGEYLVHVRNVGTVSSNGSTVTVVDRLPPGVTATSAGGQVEEREPASSAYWECTVGSGGTAVTCTNNPAGLPAITLGGERTVGRAELPTAPLIAIQVTVSAGASGTAANDVNVTGGGAREAAISTPTTIGFAPVGFGLASVEQLLLEPNGSPATRAGTHPYQLITNLTLNNPGRRAVQELPAIGEMKDLEVGLPLGFVGNPDATPKCSRKAFDEGREGVKGLPECPTDTQVGTVIATIDYPFFELVLPVYNVEPPRGVPAQFGFAFRDTVGFVDGGVRTGEGDGLKVVLNSVNQLDVLRSSLTLWGVPAAPSHDAERGYPALNGEGGPVASDVPPVPLLTNPTSCHTPLASLVSADSWAQPTMEPALPFSYPFTHEYPVTDNEGNQISMQDCSSLEFKPTLSIAPSPETTAANTPTGLDVDVHLPQNEEPEEEGGPRQLAEAQLKDAVVTLPQGMAVSASAANGLQACTAEEIGLNNGNAPSCPDASKVGTATVETPLLPQSLNGFVYVAKQNENPFSSLLAIYITAEADGALIKLAGHVQANPVTGQLTTTFDENPQLPFTDLKLHLFSGPRAALVTPGQCGHYAPSAQLSGWNGALAVPAIAPFAIESGCATGAFAPSFAAGTTKNQAGGFGRLSAIIERPDGDQALKAISLTAPPGLSGMLSQVPLCGEPQASQGDCPQASLIGHTTAVAGPGPDPVTVGGGQIFLTGPYNGGPFGLSIVVPAVAGPFNLGTVVVQAGIYVNPHTAQITVVSDPLPTIMQGIPLDIRTVNANVDREDFIFNPTSCAPLTVNGTIAGSEGASVAVSSHFQAANCASLPFKPGFSVSTQGATSKAKGASLYVKVTSSSGQANIAKVEVKLPKRLPSRLTTLRQACLAATFEANPATCPAGSLVGSAKATTPVLPVALTGPVYLVSHGGEAFPDVVVILQGEGVRLDLTGNTNISKGITSSTFASVPDEPVSTFELTLPEQSNSALTTDLPSKAHGDLCGVKLTMPTTIDGQDGAQVTQSTAIAVTGCPKIKAKARPKARKARKHSR